MKTLIEKQAAAAAHLSNNSSRLEDFASCSPPRRPGAGDPRTSARIQPRGGRQGTRNSDTDPPVGPSVESSGGIALSQLVSATSPPQRRSTIKLGGCVTGEASGMEDVARRSLAQETYTKTFSGMQVWYHVGWRLDRVPNTVEGDAKPPGIEGFLPSSPVISYTSHNIRYRKRQKSVTVTNAVCDRKQSLADLMPRLSV